MRPLGFPRRLRLRRRAEFLRIQGRGEKHHVRYYLVFVQRHRVPSDDSSRQPLPGPRLGITVTRKVGNAVVRNRIKRWVREAFRHHQSSLPTDVDMVWIAKREAPSATFHETCSDVKALAKQIERRGRSRQNRAPR